LVSFAVRLQKAARRERIALKYVRETREDASDQSEPFNAEEKNQESNKRPPADALHPLGPSDVRSEILPVRQVYFSEGQREPSSTAELQRGYEVAPDKFVVVRPEELKRLRQATSPDMQILRSVKMQEIDPVFLETSYYVVPGLGGEKSYSLFYRALAETKLAALAQVAMHGRDQVIVLRAGAKRLIAHTMFYVNEVRRVDEYAGETPEVIGKELDLAKKYIEALVEPFKPEEFTDGYREQLQALIASKAVSQPAAENGEPMQTMGKVVDIMDALRKSLETAKAANAQRKPAASEAATDRKPRKRKA
jgi:DNA end-binding protein Ku